jgi:D-galactarolactone cycloisomerase
VLVKITTAVGSSDQAVPGYAVGFSLGYAKPAALASAAGLPICTHGSHAGLNMAASVHFLASIDNAGYFEGDGSTDNPIRTELCSSSYELGADGAVRPLTGAGPEVGLDETFIQAHPLADGPAWH